MSGKNVLSETQSAHSWITFLLLTAIASRHIKILKMYTELKQIKYTQQLQRQRINEDDWQYLKSHYAWIWSDYKRSSSRQVFEL